MILFALAMAGCGDDKKSSGPSSNLSDATESRVLVGKDEQGEPCSLTTPTEGRKEIELKGKFKVDYKIPAPFSRIYGVRYWDATFSTSRNVTGEPTLSKPFFFKKEVLEGRGKHLLWDGDADHRLEFKPSLAAPVEVTYHSAQLIGNVIPFVIIDLRCRF